MTRRATTGGETWEYLWDARDKMTKVRKQPFGGAMADVASYTYDALGRRFQKTAGGATTTYYQDGLTPVVEAKAGLTKRHRAFEGDLGNVVQTVDGTNNTFYAYDARLGNVVATFGTDGLLKQSYNSYGMDAFGNVYAGNPENFGITTKQLDADTGLYYFNARWYEGDLGAFFSRTAYHRVYESSYCLAENNTINESDPSGKEPTVCFLIATAVGLFVKKCIDAAADGKDAAGASAECEAARKEMERWAKDPMLQLHPNWAKNYQKAVEDYQNACANAAACLYKAGNSAKDAVDSAGGPSKKSPPPLR